MVNFKNRLVCIFVSIFLLKVSNSVFASYINNQEKFESVEEIKPLYLNNFNMEENRFFAENYDKNYLDPIPSNFERGISSLDLVVADCDEALKIYIISKMYDLFLDNCDSPNKENKNSKPLNFNKKISGRCFIGRKPSIYKEPYSNKRGKYYIYPENYDNNNIFHLSLDDKSVKFKDPFLLKSKIENAYNEVLSYCQDNKLKFYSRSYTTNLDDLAGFVEDYRDFIEYCFELYDYIKKDFNITLKEYYEQNYGKVNSEINENLTKKLDLDYKKNYKKKFLESKISEIPKISEYIESKILKNVDFYEYKDVIEQLKEMKIGDVLKEFDKVHLYMQFIDRVMSDLDSLRYCRHVTEEGKFYYSKEKKIVEAKNLYGEGEALQKDRRFYYGDLSIDFRVYPKEYAIDSEYILNKTDVGDEQYIFLPDLQNLKEYGEDYFTYLAIKNLTNVSLFCFFPSFKDKLKHIPDDFKGWHLTKKLFPEELKYGKKSSKIKNYINHIKYSGKYFAHPVLVWNYPMSTYELVFQIWCKDLDIRKCFLNIFDKFIVKELQNFGFELASNILYYYDYVDKDLSEVKVYIPSKQYFDVLGKLANNILSNGKKLDEINKQLKEHFENIFETRYKVLKDDSEKNLEFNLINTLIFCFKNAYYKTKKFIFENLDDISINNFKFCGNKDVERENKFDSKKSFQHKPPVESTFSEQKLNNDEKLKKYVDNSDTDLEENTPVYSSSYIKKMYRENDLLKYMFLDCDDYSDSYWGARFNLNNQKIRSKVLEDKLRNDSKFNLFINYNMANLVGQIKNGNINMKNDIYLHHDIFFEDGMEKDYYYYKYNYYNMDKNNINKNEKSDVKNDIMSYLDIFESLKDLKDENFVELDENEVKSTGIKYKFFPLIINAESLEGVISELNIMLKECDDVKDKKKKILEQIELLTSLKEYLKYEFLVCNNNNYFLFLKSEKELEKMKIEKEKLEKLKKELSEKFRFCVPSIKINNVFKNREDKVYNYYDAHNVLKNYIENMAIAIRANKLLIQKKNKLDRLNINKMEKEGGKTVLDVSSDEEAKDYVYGSLNSYINILMKNRFLPYPKIYFPLIEKLKEHEIEKTKNKIKSENIECNFDDIENYFNHFGLDVPIKGYFAIVNRIKLLNKEIAKISKEFLEKSPKLKNLKKNNKELKKEIEDLKQKKDILYSESDKVEKSFNFKNIGTKLKNTCVDVEKIKNILKESGINFYDDQISNNENTYNSNSYVLDEKTKIYKENEKEISKIESRVKILNDAFEVLENELKKLYLYVVEYGNLNIYKNNLKEIAESYIQKIKEKVSKPKKVIILKQSFKEDENLKKKENVEKKETKKEISNIRKEEKNKEKKPKIQMLMPAKIYTSKAYTFDENEDSEESENSK